ncbi:sulfonate ABC transporter substrate-binding protein [Aquitalea sp. LB_tupeE]|uniref:sulfonate ABC transporter substrate-binding protein n=1 Tax=Aquitalea sp. LB_tupeE TaxID=2748078 RepID=UPI0015BF1F34|nr:sulfonate ABC transporter substrate-binding protein [Aquitalea sp. LB_tupeE]NWK80009.1 sulfonate ABC transporter substrate-binding protein [Aquitalea sp. LB_tupeE]
MTVSILKKTLGLAVLAGWSLAAQALDLNVGYQKSAINLVSLKAQGTLEKQLAPLGVTVKWYEFQAGPPILEAMNAGSVSIGMTGDSPPVFAQAAGANIVYIGQEPSKPESSAILLPANSPIKKLADLKGKRVAFTKGSSAHYLTVAALKKAGLQYSDITPVYLTPSEARAAFERGSVDAWSIWDPYYAAATRAGGVRVLSSGKGLSANNTFYLAARDFAQANPKVIAIVFKALTDNNKQLRGDVQQVAKTLSGYTGLEAETYAAMLSRHPDYSVSYVNAKTIQQQQQVADTFHALGLIPKAIKVQDAVWKP